MHAPDPQRVWQEIAETHISMKVATQTMKHMYKKMKKMYTQSKNHSRNHEKQKIIHRQWKPPKNSTLQIYLFKHKNRQSNTV
jgi:hypothetical protein